MQCHPPQPGQEPSALQWMIPSVEKREAGNVNVNIRKAFNAKIKQFNCVFETACLKKYLEFLRSYHANRGNKPKNWLYAFE